MAATPSLGSVSPTSYPADSSLHTMQLFGSNFASADTLTFTEPEGESMPNARAISFVSSNEIDYQFNDVGDAGSWSVRVNSPDGSLHSSFVAFSVPAATPAPSATPTPSLGSVSPT